MGLLESKPQKQKDLEHKIKVLRGAGMDASADRLEVQLKQIIRAPSEKIKPMSPQELAKQAKAQRVMAGKAA
jgi:hypothetical protein